MSNTPDGKFLRILTQPNQEIRRSRAESAARKLYRAYVRYADKLEDEIEQCVTELDEMLDLAPGKTTTLQVVDSFDAEEFVARRSQLGVRKDNAEQRLRILNKDFENMFDTTDAAVEDVDESFEESGGGLPRRTATPRTMYGKCPATNNR